MLLRIFTEPQQGATYDQLKTVAQLSEQLGFDAFFRSDHYLAFTGDGLPGPTDAWITLAGLARETTTIRLGTLVSPVTFRNPGPLAISVAQVDHMSNGRVELGLGTGWFPGEHAAYALPFPELKIRFEMLTEQLEIVTSLWTQKTTNHAGTHYTVTDSPGLPKPVQRPHPPIIMGGAGATKTPRLAARFADEFNVPFHPLDATKAQLDRVVAACQQTQRQPVLSAALTVCCAANTKDLKRRAKNIGRTVDHVLEWDLAGTPQQVIDRIHAYAGVGATRMYLQVLDLDDLDHLRLIAEEVMPHV